MWVSQELGQLLLPFVPKAVLGTAVGPLQTGFAHGLLPAPLQHIHPWLLPEGPLHLRRHQLCGLYVCFRFEGKSRIFPVFLVFPLWLLGTWRGSIPPFKGKSAKRMIQSQVTGFERLSLG